MRARIEPGGGVGVVEVDAELRGSKAVADEGEDAEGEGEEEIGEMCELVLEILPHVATVGTVAAREAAAAAAVAAAPLARVTVGAPVRRVGGRVAASVHGQLTLPAAAARPWSAESPALYTLLLTLRRRADGAVLEVIRSACGLRTAEVRRGRLSLTLTQTLTLSLSLSLTLALTLSRCAAAGCSSTAWR